MQEETRKYVEVFWTLVDEILNAVLFLVIGLEVLAITFETDSLIAGCMAILLALIARLIAVATHVLLLKPLQTFSKGAIPITTWRGGGVKRGISVALALSLPDGEWKPLILTVTCIVVTYSTIVQGLKMTRLIERLN